MGRSHELVNAVLYKLLGYCGMALPNEIDHFPMAWEIRQPAAGVLPNFYHSQQNEGEQRAQLARLHIL